MRERRTLKHYDLLIKRTESDLLQLMEKMSFETHKVRQQALIKRYRQLINKLDTLKQSRRELGSGNLVIIKGAVNKKEQNSNLSLPRRFIIYFHDISLEDARTLVKEKLPEVNLKTIEIQTLKLGEVHIL